MGRASEPATTARSRPLRPAATLLAVGALGGTYGLLFPDRSDYLGHFLAGTGGTLLLLAVVVAAFPGRVAAVLVAVGAAIAVGVLAEATIFRFAEFDPVDLANQSLGAAFAGVALLDAETRPASTGLAAVAGVALLLAGFHYAFP
jgi:hypothetical protein